MRDVDRQIGPRLAELFEQQPGLEAAAAAEFDQLAIRADRLGHLGGVALEDRQLGARQIILVELADLVEERRAAFIVKVLAGDVLLGPAQAVEHVVAESIESATRSSRSWRQIVVVDGVMRLSPVGFR